MAEASPFAVIVMAAQRAGVVNPLAERAGVSHKCVVPICGKPLILHVFEALAATPGVSEVRVSLEPEAWDLVRALSAPLDDKGIALGFVASAESIADSAYRSAEGIAGPFLITTADNVLMTPDAARRMMASVTEADVAVGLTTREAVLEARGEVPGPDNTNVGPYKFSDVRVSNCNLYAFRSAEVLRAAEMFREGGQFSKSKGRLIRAVGLMNVVLVALGLVTLEGGFRRISRRLGIRMAPVVLADGSQAIDVDNFKTYDRAERFLKQRAQ
ncbi:MAG TPA: NTP transferase domain-containing protein [Novosphingobium sp.]|nr:NTP transferase domain-containing protein [Novosphingobium sp.]